jgi:hypothetical protein
MLAHTVYLDVSHNDHIIDLRFENRVDNYLPGFAFVSVREKLERVGNALGRLDKPFAVGIFAHFDE